MLFSFLYLYFCCSPPLSVSVLSRVAIHFDYSNSRTTLIGEFLAWFNLRLGFTLKASIHLYLWKRQISDCLGLVGAVVLYFYYQVLILPTRQSHFRLHRHCIWRGNVVWYYRSEANWNDGVFLFLPREILIWCSLTQKINQLSLV